MSVLRTLMNAERISGKYETIITSIPYEEKGVLFSEMLFLLSTIGDLKPRQVLESGRGRGQSTQILAVCLPESHIISVEYHAESSDVPIAQKRLEPYRNVSLLFGDSRKILPSLLLPGDVVFIDGPKGLRSLKLALELFCCALTPSAVFLHDTFGNSSVRTFLNRYIPATIFSDYPDFVQQYKHLDEKCWEFNRRNEYKGWQPYVFHNKKQLSYGPTIACISGISRLHAFYLLARLSFFAMQYRLKRSVSKRVFKKANIHP